MLTFPLSCKNTRHIKVFPSKLSEPPAHFLLTFWGTSCRRATWKQRSSTLHAHVIYPKLHHDLAPHTHNSRRHRTGSSAFPCSLSRKNPNPGFLVYIPRSSAFHTLTGSQFTGQHPPLHLHQPGLCISLSCKRCQKTWLPGRAILFSHQVNDNLSLIFPAINAEEWSTTLSRCCLSRLMLRCNPVNLPVF